MSAGSRSERIRSDADRGETGGVVLSSPLRNSLRDIREALQQGIELPAAVPSVKHLASGLFDCDHVAFIRHKPAVFDRVMPTAVGQLALKCHPGRIDVNTRPRSLDVRAGEPSQSAIKGRSEAV
jgi:hypothetical protein